MADDSIKFTASKSAVDVPQIKMSDDELNVFMKGFDNLTTGLDEMSKFDFSASSSSYEYKSGFERGRDNGDKASDNTNDTNKTSTASNDIKDTLLNFRIYETHISGMSVLGKYLPNFKHYCEVCGKEIGSNEKWGEYIKLIPFNGGYCSFKCATKAVMDLIMNNVIPTLRQDKEWLNDIQASLNFVNTLCNMINEIPYVVQNLSRIPDVYHNYVMQKLFIVFNLLRILVNKVMYFKNKVIIAMLTKIKNGSFSSEILNAMEWVNTAMTTINALMQSFEKGYGIASQMINEALRAFCLPAEGMGFFMTTRSIIASPGNILIPVDKNANLKMSVIDSVDIGKIVDMIKFTLPPIQEPEFFLEPNVFELRYILSSDNYKLVGKYMSLLMDWLKFGADYMPPYKKLVPYNPFFMLALVYGWCPCTQMLFGKELGTELPGVAASYNAKIATQV